MLLAFYYFKMMFTDCLLILVLILDFTFFCSKFYVLINRFSFRHQFLFYWKKCLLFKSAICVYLSIACFIAQRIVFVE